MKKKERVIRALRKEPEHDPDAEARLIRAIEMLTPEAEARGMTVIEYARYILTNEKANAEN